MQSSNYKSTLAAVLFVFAAVTCVDAAVLWLTRDRHLGIHEDHFDKGVALYETGSISSGSKPSVFRPPGYPVFVAATLAVADAIGGGTPLSGAPGAGRRVAVLAAHALLLGVLGGAMMWFALERTGLMVAAACSIAVGCNPLLLVIAGHVSYPLLHIVLLSLGTLALLKHIDATPRPAATMFGNGLVWGAATLVKSVTLIAPLFIFLWHASHDGVRAAGRATALFTAGLLLALAPYTARNYAVTGRFIPVNAQASYALWATSLERIPPDRSYLHWVDTWFASAMPIYTEVTGRTDYSAVVFEDHVLELGDRFRAMAAANITRHPAVYAYNALHNSVLFVVDPPTAYWFENYALARPAGGRAAGTIAGLSIGVMTVVSMIAMVIGCVHRDRRWTLLLALLAMMWASHALTFLEARYLYIKLPTIVIGFVLAVVVASSEMGSRWQRGAARLAIGAAILTVIGLLAL